MRLRTKYGVVLLVATLVLSGGVYGGFELYERQVVSQTQAEVDETADLTAEQLDTVVRERKDFVGFVASRPRASEFEDSDAFLAEVVDNSRYFAGQIVDEEGTIVAFHGDVSGAVQEEAIGQTVADRPYVQAALEGEVYVSELERANATGDYVAIISAPVFRDREIVGVLAVATYVDEPTFFPMLAPVETRDQTVLVRDGETTLYGDADAVPASAITSTVVAEETGWTVQVARDRRALNAQLDALALGQGLGLAAVLLGMLGFAVWEYRTSLRQIDRLGEGFGALEAGDYDYSLALTAADEWQRISDGFNAMGAALASRERQLRLRQQRLEVLNRVLRHNLRNSAVVLLGYGQKVQEEATQPALSRAGELIATRASELSSLGETARELEHALDDGESPPGPVEAVSLVEPVVERLRGAHPEVALEADLPDAAWVVATPALEKTVEHLLANACEHNDDPEPRVRVSVTLPGDDPPPVGFAGPDPAVAAAESLGEFLVARDDVPDEPAVGDDAAVADGRDGEGPARVILRVEDNGPGIPEHERAVLESGRETPLEHGSGLGLWLVHWTVDRFGGDLAFDDAPGGGAVVTITLDAAQPAPWPDDEDGAMAVGADGRPAVDGDGAAAAGPAPTAVDERAGDDTDETGGVTDSSVGIRE